MNVPFAFDYRSSAVVYYSTRVISDAHTVSETALMLTLSKPLSPSSLSFLKQGRVTSEVKLEVTGDIGLSDW